MKNRWILALSALFSVFLLSIAAAAAETYQSMAELYQHWSATQMPDWVCSVDPTEKFCSREVIRAMD